VKKILIYFFETMQVFTVTFVHPINASLLKKKIYILNYTIYDVLYTLSYIIVH